MRNPGRRLNLHWCSDVALERMREACGRNCTLGHGVRLTEAQQRRRLICRRLPPFMRDFDAHHLPKTGPFHASNARR